MCYLTESWLGQNVNWLCLSDEGKGRGDLPTDGGRAANEVNSGGGGGGGFVRCRGEGNYTQQQCRFHPTAGG